MMSDEEAEELFGSGLIVFGVRPPPGWKPKGKDATPPPSGEVAALPSGTDEQKED
jgi:hypothetical protein